MVWFKIRLFIFSLYLILSCFLVTCSKSVTLQDQVDEMDTDSLIWDETAMSIVNEKSLKKEKRKSERACHEYIMQLHLQGAVIDPGYIIIGGTEVLLHEFPHMAALGWIRYDGSLAFKCGGSLISDKFVLTAGHCTRLPKNTEFAHLEPRIVRLGEHNIKEERDGADPKDIPIKTIIKHPQYQPPKKYYDIALIELEERAVFNSFIVPACLWNKDEFGEHKTAVATGWGTTVAGKQENSPVLQKVTLDIINNYSCDALLSHFHNRHWNGIRSHQMCAGTSAGGKDSCKGDSGGPLQLTLSRPLYRIYVIGVTSFGRECAKPNQPGIYTKVFYFLDWIESIVWPDDD